MKSLSKFLRRDLFAAGSRGALKPLDNGKIGNFSIKQFGNSHTNRTKQRIREQTLINAVIESHKTVCEEPSIRPIAGNLFFFSERKTG